MKEREDVGFDGSRRMGCEWRYLSGKAVLALGLNYKDDRKDYLA
jgi:hypothetical protein